MRRLPTPLFLPPSCSLLLPEACVYAHSLPLRAPFPSYLPLAHIFETALVIGLVLFGGSIGFYQGDVRKLVDDIATLRPTILAGVPRVWTRIHDKVKAGLEASSWIKRTMFDLAYSYQVAWCPVAAERLCTACRMAFAPGAPAHARHARPLAFLFYPGGEPAQRLSQPRLGQAGL